MENLSNDFLEIEEDKKESWKVDNDLSADWALDRIREIEAEYKRFEIVAKEKMKQIQEKLNEKRKQADDERNYFDYKLREYFENVKAKETKTQKKYDLPSGKLVLKKSKETFDYDKTQLLEYAEKEKYEDLIKVKKDFDWAEFKKNLAIKEGKILNKLTGEILDIEGLGIKQTQEDFKIEY